MKDAFLPMKNLVEFPVMNGTVYSGITKNDEFLLHKFSLVSYRPSLCYLISHPEFPALSVEWFAHWKFNNSQSSRNSLSKFSFRNF